MQIRAFIHQHKASWNYLEKLMIKLKREKKSIDGDDLDRFTHLYKQASGHLAYAQTYYPGSSISQYLNQLVSNAHHLLFSGQTRSSHQLSHFFKHIFIEIILKRQRFILAAFLIFLIGGISGFVSVWAVPSHLYAIFPNFTSPYNAQHLGQQPIHANHPVMATTIMTNNIKVAVLAYIGGITFGLFTVYALLKNGVLVGALAAVFAHAGNSYVFWAYILPHGVIELTVIFVAGGSGLYMGYRMFVPGNLPWRLRLIESAKESVQLMLGTIPLFVIAGTIEGYITPSELPLFAKYAVAGITMLFLLSYYLYGVRLRYLKAR